ncbi:MAG TPA: helicase-related protein, partial [Planctomycetota bacterium]|nr:helicase-related protein [Planctomycetota bacterium]
MPRIFDNIDQQLLPALQQTLQLSDRADFCVGYFNLRGWKQLGSYIEQWSGGPGSCCRLLVGMQKLPQDELREALSLIRSGQDLDNQTALRLKKKLAAEFRRQLMVGAPTNEDEIGLRRLAAQLNAKKVVVKLFLRHALHAKLYLLFRPDPINPEVGYLGSSNLTFSGLSHQGELNVDVVDHDACQKLARWFEDRWEDRWCIDISEDLVRIIEESWAREETIPPFHIYIKMAYHLSQEARSGIAEFGIPKVFGDRLFDFQAKAVQIAAHHISKRGGVLIGDVVGLGKTLMASAVARIFEDDHGFETLIICPKNLEPMWDDYRMRYGLRATILRSSKVIDKLPDLPRHRLVIIDESHNFRNRDGKRYGYIREYVEKNDSKCVLLSATPYNKDYRDLSNQLRLFVPEDIDVGIRPEQYLKAIGGEVAFGAKHQVPVRSIGAFEHSQFPDDWRELMRLYMVRRTRTFIKEHYAHPDPDNGRQYLLLENGDRSYFPTREPKKVEFTVNEDDPDDQYAKLYADDVVDTLDSLHLPRYGLGNYVADDADTHASPKELPVLEGLSRAGKRLKGFCRTNLFKRLESSGYVFLQSIQRHILRNFVFIHAMENGLHLPIGTQDAQLLDTRVRDEDSDSLFGPSDEEGDEGDGNGSSRDESVGPRTEQEFRQRAAQVYREYEQQYASRFKWLKVPLFEERLVEHLLEDAHALMSILNERGGWDTQHDTKLDALEELVSEKHENEKVLIFTQFADTVRYLTTQLKARGVAKIEGVTGDAENPTALAWRFSPESNERRNKVSPERELRTLIATDVLSEGQNLQDCSTVVCYDLPWAIIRLIQRVGRVDRIGQQAEIITCYSFLPAKGVEKVINLRGRLSQRLQENGEVVGSDEAFFEDQDRQAVVDLYNEKSGILDGDDDSEIDLASRALQVWKNAIENDPELEKIIQEMPDVVYSVRQHSPTEEAPEGALLYTRTAQGNDALAWIDKNGNSVTESQYKILKAAECEPDTPSVPRDPDHHNLVLSGVKLIAKQEKSVGGQLGRKSSARYRTYTRLKSYLDQAQGTLFGAGSRLQELGRALEEIYKYPLRQAAIDRMNRHLRAGISDDDLAELVLTLRDEDRL